jgi:hypothetical protein
MCCVTGQWHSPRYCILMQALGCQVWAKTFLTATASVDGTHLNKYTESRKNRHLLPAEVNYILQLINTEFHVGSCLLDWFKLREVSFVIPITGSTGY